MRIFRLLSAILLVVLFLPDSAPGKIDVSAKQPQLKPLKIIFQWGGSDSGYPGNPPFFIIRSLDEFEKFWAQHQPNECMPHVEFSKHMVFVWAPGPTLFDYRPTKVVGFQRRGKGYLVILEYDRKLSGGYWRAPFLIAILSKADNGDISVVRLGNKSLSEKPLVPLYHIWEIGAARTVSPREIVYKPPQIPTNSGEKLAAPKIVASKLPALSSSTTSGKYLPPKDIPGKIPSLIIQKDAASAKTSSSAAGKVAAASDNGKASSTVKGTTNARTTASSGAKIDNAKTNTTATGRNGAAKTANNATTSGSDNTNTKNASDSADPFGDAFNLDF